MFTQPQKAICAIIVIVAFLITIGFVPTAEAQYHPSPPKEETSTGTLVAIALVGVAVIATLLIIKHHKDKKKKEEKEDSEEEQDSTSTQSSYLEYQFFTGSKESGMGKQLWDASKEVRLRPYLGVRCDNLDPLTMRKSDFHFSDQTIVAGISLEF